MDLLAKKRPFIIRLDAGKSSRKMRTPSGQRSYVANIARRLKPPYDLQDFPPQFRGRFGWTQVRFLYYRILPGVNALLRDFARNPILIVRSS